MADAKTAKKSGVKAKAAPRPKAETPIATPKPARPRKERATRPEGTLSSRKGSRKVREGLVVSNKMARTVVVSIERRIQHPLYGKVVQRSERFKVHDEIGCDVGDRVQIMETRPISREKRWRVTKIVEKVK